MKPPLGSLAPLLLACLALCAGAAPGGDVTAFLRQTMPEAAEPAATAANGRLAVSFDVVGGLVSVLWPGAGGVEQAGRLPGAPKPRAARWGVDTGDGVVWMDAPEARASTANTGRALVETAWQTEVGEIRQRVVVPPEMDGFVTEISGRGGAEPRALVWEQALLPATDRPRGVPLAAPPFAAARGFAGAVFGDGRGAFVFRPGEPAPEDRERARRLAEEDANRAGWDIFEGGTWIATGATGRMTARFPDAPPPGQAAAGAASARLELRVSPVRDGEAWRAVAAVAFGGSRSSATETLRALLDRPFSEWAAAAETAGEPPQPLPEAARRAVDRLLLSWDDLRDTVVFAPCGTPPLAVVTPQLAACAALALSKTGLTERAERQLDFLMGLARTKETATAPAGSLPVLAHADGARAFPEAVVNASDAAWCLLALRDATALWPEARRNAFLAKHRDKAAVLGDFLVRWADLNTGEPLPDFDWRALRPAASFESLLAGLLGIGAAGDLAAAAPREWTEWRRGLEARVRFALANDPASVTLSPSLAAWIAATNTAGLPPGFRGTVARTVPFDGPETLGDAARRALGGEAPGDALAAALQLLLAPSGG